MAAKGQRSKAISMYAKKLHTKRFGAYSATDFLKLKKRMWKLLPAQKSSVMRYYTLVLTLIIGFIVGCYWSNSGLAAGNVVFKNLKDGNGVTTADVFVLGERKILTKELTLIAKDWPLYDSKGNRLVRFLEDNR
jgi:hypothetical protein